MNNNEMWQKGKRDFYRNAWMEYRECKDEERKKVLEQIMDKAQDYFTWDEFQEFKQTLPEFVDFWAGKKAEMLFLLNMKFSRS